MNIGLKQTPTQQMQQRLIMTPKLQQAIKVLLMSRMDLTQYITQQLEQNIFIEDVQDEVEVDALAEVEALDPDEGWNEPQEIVEREDKDPDIDWENCFDDMISLSEKTAFEHWDGENRPQADVAQPESLQDSLMNQLNLAPVSEKEWEIGEQIIGNLDDDGRLTVSLEEIADAVGCEVDEVEEMLTFIQNNFEPTGIAYRTIPETLLLQMKVAQIDNPIAKEIIKNHYEDLVNNHLSRIAQKINVEINEVLEARKVISSLHPYPGRHSSNYSDPTRSHDGNVPVRLIIPDVTVQKIDEKYRVMTNDDGMPLLRLNPYYVNMMRNGHQDLDPKTKEWMENYKCQAVDLIKSINQRRQTIARVTEAIFDVQADFLEEGINGLKPLVLREIADRAGVHESTVSRVTSNKYVETPQGIYKLKYFFSSELPTDSGLNIAATTVKDKIREMIEKENPAKPMSDQEIAEVLKSEGIQVARRTVAKYREDLGILSSSKRKREW